MYELRVRFDVSGRADVADLPWRTIGKLFNTWDDAENYVLGMRDVIMYRIVEVV